MAGSWWSGLAAWLGSADRGALIVGAELVLGAAALPLWLAWLEARRWRALRRRLVRACFDLYRAGAGNSVAVSRALLREQHGPPLTRLATVRGAIERQRAANARLAQLAAIGAASVNAKLADLLAAATALGSGTEAALVALTRAYLAEARAHVASNVVHGDDVLHYGDGQLIPLPQVESLQALTAWLAEDSAALAGRIARQLGRRDRRARRADFEAAEDDLASFDADVNAFLASLQPADPDSAEYRSRPRGDRGGRTLDGLIARFGRGGVLPADAV